MSKYLQVAADANKQINKIIEMTSFGATPDVKAQVAKELAYLYNLGIRTSPRPCQTTVRLRAVQAALKDYPVSARMEECQGDNPQYKYNKLVMEVKANV